MAKTVSDLLASVASLQKMGQAMLDAADAIAVLDGKADALAALDKRIAAAQTGLASINGEAAKAQEAIVKSGDEAKAIIAKANGEAADIRAKLEKQAKDATRKTNDDLEKATRRLADLEKLIKSHESDEAAACERVAAAAKLEADILARIQEHKKKLLAALEA